MKNLNLILAKSIALKYFNQMKDKEETSFNMVHTKAVADIALLLGKRLKINTRDLVIAAWVHDIGKSVSVVGHAKHSLDILINNGFSLSPIIQDCILNHGTGSVAQTREGKIIQAADKLSIMSIPVLKLLFKQKKILDSDLEFIEKMTKGSLEHLKRVDNI